VTADDLGHLLTRFGPFLLVIAWAVMVAIFRRKPERPADVPAPKPVVAQPRPVVSAPPPRPASRPQPTPPPQPAPAPRRPAPPAPEPALTAAVLARAASVARVVARDRAEAAEEAAGSLRAQLSEVGWQQAVVLTEILGPPLALRRPGTLGPPGAL
jgi:hypothetical protein